MGRLVYRDGWFLFALFTVALSLDMFQLYTVNGIGDFLTMVLLGTVEFGSDSFVTKLGIYVLMVPLFIGLKLLSTAWRYPSVLRRGFPPDDYYPVLNMDHFANAVFMMSLPAAFEQLGAWLFSLGVIVGGLFVLPRFVSEAQRPFVRFGGVVAGVGLQAWLTVQQLHGPLPDPSTVMPSWVLVRLSETQVQLLLDATQSVVLGPLLVPVLSIALASVFASRAMEQTPVFRDLNPERTSWFVIGISSFLGTVTYLALQGALTGSVLVIP